MYAKKPVDTPRVIRYLLRIMQREMI